MSSQFKNLLDFFGLGNVDCGKTALQKIVGAGCFNVYWLDGMLYNR